MSEPMSDHELNTMREWLLASSSQTAVAGQRLLAEVDRLRAFAVALCGDDTGNLDYWAQEYKHAYKRLCEVDLMNAEIITLRKEKEQVYIAGLEEAAKLACPNCAQRMPLRLESGMRWHELPPAPNFGKLNPVARMTSCFANSIHTRIAEIRQEAKP